jgi:hypothetical protein
LLNDLIRSDKAPTNSYRRISARSCIALRKICAPRASWDGVIKVGDPLPPFALKNALGREVRSSELLANGPLVLTVFRGSW